MSVKLRHVVDTTCQQQISCCLCKRESLQHMDLRERLHLSLPLCFEKAFKHSRRHIFIPIAPHTKYVYIKSTTLYVPSSELGLSQPLSRQRVCLSLRTKGGGGGGHTRLLVRGCGSCNSDDWRKSLALCLKICGTTGPVQ
jgi:hypothetical protein